MSDSTTYKYGPSGTISGFTTNDTGLEAVNISIEMLYAKLRDIETKSTTDYDPAQLRALLLDHISDTNNPHRDSFNTLGFNVASDLVGSLLPGTVPTQCPSYVIDPISIIPSINFPSNNSAGSYVADLVPIIKHNGDEGSFDKNLVWLDEYYKTVSLADFENSKTDDGYSLAPLISLSTGIPGLLLLDTMTPYNSLDPSAFSLDANTGKDGYLWNITTTNRVVKLLPTFRVTVNTNNNSNSETTFLWAGLNNMNLGDKSNLYVIFSINNCKMVVKYTKDSSVLPEIEIVYKSGNIEPVMFTGYSMGGVRFLAKRGDVLTVNWTITPAPDWGNYSDTDITFNGGDVTFSMPNFYNTRFMLGNPNMLSGHTKNSGGVTSFGLMLNNPPNNGASTSTLAWDLPVLSSLSNVNMVSLTVAIDHSVDTNAYPTMIYYSDHLSISLITLDDGTTSKSTWTINVSDDTNSTSLNVNGAGGLLQSIALSCDGSYLRVRVSGGSGINQVPCKVNLNTLPNSKFLPFSGAIVGMEVYGIGDDSGTLDFLVGDTTNS